MSEWIEELSCYMAGLEKAPSSLLELTEEVHQAGIETDFLLTASDQLKLAYTTLIGKHAGS
jgi:hypothetical protein